MIWILILALLGLILSVWVVIRLKVSQKEVDQVIKERDQSRFFLSQHRD